MYTVDVAGWHLIALDSNTQIGPARINNEVAKLQADLAATPPNTCTLAYFHHPVQNAGPEGEPVPGSLAARLWSALIGKADVVLNGHDHSYQRFKPVSGTTEIVDGTLGRSGQAPGPDPRLVTFFGDIFGALRAELNPHGFGFRFIAEDGRVLDSGAIPCAGAADTAAPAAPAGLVEGSVSRTTAEIRWQTPTDDVGVTGYDVLRDGVVVGSTAGDTRFVDSSVQAGTAYTYRVRARDRAGHVSAPSSPARRPAELRGLPRHVRVGQPGSLDDARRRGCRDACGPPYRCERPAGDRPRRPREREQDAGDDVGTLEALVHVRTTSTTQVNLVTFANGAGERIVTVYKQNGSGKLCYAVGQLPGAVTTKCQTNVPTVRFDNGAWHTLRVRATTGASPALTVRLDDAALPGLDGSPPLGTSPVARLLLGATILGQTFQADFDQVAADPLPIGDIDARQRRRPSLPERSVPLQVNVAWAPSADDVGVTGYLHLPQRAPGRYDQRDELHRPECRRPCQLRLHRARPRCGRQRVAPLGGSVGRHAHRAAGAIRHRRLPEALRAGGRPPLGCGVAKRCPAVERARPHLAARSDVTAVRPHQVPHRHPRRQRGHRCCRFARPPERCCRPASTPAVPSERCGPPARSGTTCRFTPTSAAGCRRSSSTARSGRSSRGSCPPGSRRSRPSSSAAPGSSTCSSTTSRPTRSS